VAQNETAQRAGVRPGMSILGKKSDYEKDKLMNNGQRRMGNPRTDKQRKERHQRLYGNTNLPPRGTGLKRGNVLGKK